MFPQMYQIAGLLVINRLINFYEPIQARYLLSLSPKLHNA